MNLDSKLVLNVLRYVNKLRDDQGRPPIDQLPVGRRENICACPIGNALSFEPGKGAWVEAEVQDDDPGGKAKITYTDSRGSRKTVTTPKYVNDFIVAFDNGRIPELIWS